MKIGIIGTRGIPNHYGGFEQFAEYLAVGLVELGHQVTVYNSHNHPYQETSYRGVRIVHCYDPEHRLGTAGQFIYDFNCIRDTHYRHFDIILQLGYTSNSAWGWLLPRGPIVVTNMDGLEWKRSKFSPRVRQFLKKAESWGVKYSHYLVADSVGIQQHLWNTYGKESTYIPYGSHVYDDPQPAQLAEFDLTPHGYNMLVARLEPENSIDTILEGVVAAGGNRPFLVVGKHQTPYGEYLKQKYRPHTPIRFVGGIYDIRKLNNLRYFSNLYFHGHTVGGTNPSLLEAMGSGGLICAHDNIFNKAILGRDAFYFTRADDITALLGRVRKDAHLDFVTNNRHKIQTVYHWPIIIRQYLTLFEEAVGVQQGVPALVRA